MKKLIVVCDTEEGYAKRLSEYLLHKREFSVSVRGEIRTFTSANDMLTGLSGLEIFFLLISNECYTEYVNSEIKELVYVNKLVILNDEKILPASVTEDFIYKYQSASLILSKLLAECLYCDIDEGMNGKESASLIGVYSPIKRTLKTSFSYTLAQILSEEISTLYVNLEGCSGLSQMISFDSDTNLADLLFDYSLYKDEYPARLHRFITNVGSLGIILPVEGVSEIQCVECEMIFSLLGILKRNGIYNKVIMDIGDNVSGIMDILGICDTVYMPVREDYISNAKIDSFYKSLMKYSNSDEISKKIHKLEFPFFDSLDGPINNLKYGEFGEYVRKIASE